MEVNKDLLQRYVDGQCSEEEKRLVEEWLEAQDLIRGSFDQVRLQKEIKLRWTAIEHHMDKEEGAKIIPLYKKVLRYAAVACAVVAIFIAGRYSNNFQPEETLTAMQRFNQSGILHVRGGNGTEGKINGSSFDISLDGDLQLYNSSAHLMRVHCGNQVYELQPNKTYFLMGNKESSSLLSGKTLGSSEAFDFELKGDFIVREIKS